MLEIMYCSDKMKSVQDTTVSCSNLKISITHCVKSGRDLLVRSTLRELSVVAKIRKKKTRVLG